MRTEDSGQDLMVVNLTKNTFLQTQPQKQSILANQSEGPRAGK